MDNNTCPLCGTEVRIETVNNKTRVRCVKSYECRTKTPWIFSRDEATRAWDELCKGFKEPIIVMGGKNEQG